MKKRILPLLLVVLMLMLTACGQTTPAVSNPGSEVFSSDVPGKTRIAKKTRAAEQSSGEGSSGTEYSSEKVTQIVTELSKTKKTKVIKPEVDDTPVFTDDIDNGKPSNIVKGLPINNAVATIRPTEDMNAILLGQKVVQEVRDNYLGDFERSPAYCQKHKESNPDQMVHVSTFTIINNKVYMTYYANTSNAAENPDYQEARLAICTLGKPDTLQVYTVQKVGDVVDGENITMVYDTILMQKDNNELYIMWTACAGQYYRFYCVYNIKNNSFGPIRVNRFKVGSVVNDFSTSGIDRALTANNLAHKEMFSDIGIMQKLSTRVENGVKYYYTGAYSGNFTCIIKSKDLITWQYVSEPNFNNYSKWENATYVWGDKVYYFVRQEDKVQYGFLTYFDLKKKTWAAPVLVQDCQSRSDFIEYGGKLYLFHAPRSREGFGALLVDTNDLAKTKPVFVADMWSSLFYAYYLPYGNDVYMSYTVDRQHIRLTKFNLSKYL